MPAAAASKGWAEDLARMLARSEAVRAEILSLHDTSKEAVLKKARVIGRSGCCPGTA